MVKCSFSGEELPKGTGIMYIKTDGKVLYFMNRKCEKNFIKLKRKPYNVKWTQDSRKNKLAPVQSAASKETKTVKTKRKGR